MSYLTRSSQIIYKAKEAAIAKKANNNDKSPELVEKEPEPFNGAKVGGPSIPRSSLVYSPGGHGSFDRVEVKSKVKYWPLICKERWEKPKN